MRVRVVAALQAAVVAGALAQAQSADETPTVREIQQVTSYELYIGVKWGPGKRWLTGRAAPRKGFEADQLRLQVDGVPVEISSTTPGGELGAPWQIVLFFDTVLHNESGLRASASALGEVVPQLVEVGTVEVVIADPHPRIVVEATRVASVVESALSNLALLGTAEERLPALRQEYLDVVELGSLEQDSEESVELARQLAGAERAIISERLDLLTHHLVERRQPGVGRAVFWVLEGYDPLPERFYLSAADGATELGADAFDVIAGYGWTAFPYATAGQGPDVRRGFRIGKLRIAGTNLVWEGERKPQRARSLIEAGESLFEQGRFDDALESYDHALHHFLGHPKTADEQAAVWVRIARVYRTLGDLGRSRRALSYAVTLDPQLATELGSAVTYFSDVRSQLQSLANLSGGRLLATPEDVQSAAADLPARLRATFQRAGLPEGRVMALELSRTSGGEGLRYSRRLRSGVPDAVVGARLRTALREFVEEPGLAQQHVSIEAGASSSAVSVTIADSEPRDSGRMWLGILAVDGSARSLRLERVAAGWRGELADLGEVAAAAIYRDDGAAGKAWSVKAAELVGTAVR